MKGTTRLKECEPMNVKLISLRILSQWTLKLVPIVFRIVSGSFWAMLYKHCRNVAQDPFSILFVHICEVGQCAWARAHLEACSICGGHKVSQMWFRNILVCTPSSCFEWWVETCGKIHRIPDVQIPLLYPLGLPKWPHVGSKSFLYCPPIARRKIVKRAWRAVAQRSSFGPGFA